jgi:hypothetical protein
VSNSAVLRRALSTASEGWRRRTEADDQQRITGCINRWRSLTTSITPPPSFMSIIRKSIAITFRPRVRSAKEDLSHRRQKTILYSMQQQLFGCGGHAC